MLKFIIQVVCLGMACSWAEGADPAVVASGMRWETFSGWENSPALRGGDCKLVVAPIVGGRIVSYTLNGDDVFYVDPASASNTLAATPGGFSIGGYQIDLGSDRRAIPDHPALWLGPWSCKTLRPNAVALQSEPDPGLGVRLQKEIMMDPDTGEVGLEQRMTNVSNGEISFRLRDRTLCKGGGYALLPLNKQSRFRARWAMARQDAQGKTLFDGAQPSDPRAKIMGDVLVVAAKGAPLRIGVDSDQGWIAYTVGRLLFVKYYPCSRQGSEAGGPPSVEFLADERGGALEPLSPEVKLKPGESLNFPEKWVLLGLDRPAESFAEARALVKRLAPSPFKK